MTKERLTRDEWWERKHAADKESLKKRIMEDPKLAKEILEELDQ
jgi:hypothetical protein